MGLLLLILAVVVLRHGRMKVSHAVICGLLGFYLASTSVAPTIHNGMNATADIVSGIHP